MKGENHLSDLDMLIAAGKEKRAKELEKMEKQKKKINKAYELEKAAEVQLDSVEESSLSVQELDIVVCWYNGGKIQRV